MAESNQQACEAPHGQPSHGPFSVAVAAITMINRGLAAAAHAVARDGALAAAFRQGAGEIGQALKAFPDSIQVHEAGTILSPTQGEIASGRDAHAPTPSMIARGDAGAVHGPEQARPAAPSPGDVARGDGQVLAQGKPPDMGWAEWIEQQRKGDQNGDATNDQNEPEKGRSLPEEQQKQDRDRGRGR